MIGPGRTSGEEQAVGAAELDDAPDAGTGLRGAIGRVGALARDFGADRHLLTEVMRERDRCLPEIAISHARIDCIAAAAEQAGSSSEVLSGPKRQKEARLLPGRMARRREDGAREDCGGKAAALVVEEA